MLDDRVFSASARWIATGREGDGGDENAFMKSSGHFPFPSWTAWGRLLFSNSLAAATTTGALISIMSSSSSSKMADSFGMGVGDTARLGVEAREVA